ncbi:hypothetical protein C8J56DRAFT_1054757 [Mycena floridula]|nr:hypothetical protein C8J56DRAFT_1054757 [Mycena floridula]
MATKAKAWMTRNLKALGDARSGEPWTTQDLEGYWTMQDLETIRPRGEFVTKPVSQRPASSFIAFRYHHVDHEFLQCLDKSLIDPRLPWPRLWHQPALHSSLTRN